MRKKTAIILVTALVIVGALGFGAWKGYEWFIARMTPNACYLQVQGVEEPLRLTNEQAKNASIIVAESYNRGLSEQAAVIALATAWQESGLRNLNYGDRDSLGLFQQRPSYDWGTEEQIMDPWYSSGRFYEELIKFEGWESTDVNDIAQKVQRSGHPEAYRKHETNARAPAHGVLDRVGAAVPGVKLQDNGSDLTMTASNADSAWSATHLAIANAADLGVEKVVVGGNEWKQGERTWKDVRPVSGESVTVTIKLRS